MKKSILLPCLLFGAFQIAGAQATEKIEKAHKDPATQERSAQADVRLIDKTKITNEKEQSKTAAVAPGKKRKDFCKKSGKE